MRTTNDNSVDQFYAATWSLFTLRLTPELSAQEEFERKWLSQRAFIWMPGEHADVGGQNGDPVVAEHSLLTMVEQMLVYSDELNDPLYLNTEHLSDHLNSIGMDDEVQIGATGNLIKRTFRHLVGWQNRKPTEGDASALHAYAKSLVGRPNVLVKYIRKKNRTYRLNKHFNGVIVEPCTYDRIRRECALLDIGNLNAT